MIRGWYTAASGMNAQQKQLDVIAQNLANADTTSYKRDVATHKNFSELLIRRLNDDGVIKNPFGSSDVAPIIGKLGLGVELNEIFTEFEQGSLKQTNAASDLALEGKGFFCVETPYGEQYTRNGNFTVGVEGYLMTKEGYPVLGENGYIRVENDKFKVNEDGIIYTADTNDVIDRFKTVRFDNERYLKKTGQNLYKDTDISGPAHIAEGKERPRFLQGYIETSNVNVVNEMVRMIEVNRAYEANQKTISSEDSMMGTLWSKTAVFK